MIIFPAIDLKDGKVVRLYKGDFAAMEQVAKDAVATALAFQSAGAAWLHLVDLDGARDGERKNARLVEKVVQVGLRVQLGGGLRTMQDLEAVFAMGVYRAVIGSAAVSDPDFVRAALARYGSDRIAVGIDQRGGHVRTAGWTEDAGIDYLDFARQMEDLGVTKLVFTDIDSDGTLSGPNFERLQALQDTVGCDIISSGGVSSNQDIAALHQMDLYGAIVGKAWYAGAVDLREAIREGGPQQ